MKSKLGQPGIIFLISVLSLYFLASCASPAESIPPPPAGITDQLGRTVTLDKPPQRIISLAPSNTEILFALGLGDRLVAVTDYCNYPAEAKTKPSIGGFSTPNIEKVVALAPDLILATSIHEKTIIPKLEENGLTVLALNPRTIDQVIEAIALTGKACGVEENAARLVSSMRQRIKAVTDRTAGLPPEQRPSTCYIVWHDPLKIVGAGTLQDELITLAGGTNTVGALSSQTGYVAISLETFIAANPAVIMADVGMGTGADAPFQFARTESRLKDTDARQHNRVYPMDSNLASRPGPRIVDALEQFAAFIHPELFK